MAISRTATSTTGADWTNLGTSYDLSHTCLVGDTMLVVFVQVSTGNGDSVTGVTYNSVAMTQGVKVGRLSDSATFTYLYYLANPASGAHNITVSMSASETFGVVCGASYTGTTTVAPEATDTDRTSSGTSCTTTLTTITDNDWLVGGFTFGGGTMTVGANTLKIGGDVNSAIMVDSNSAQTPAGSKSMTVSGGTTNYEGVMITLQPYAVGVKPISNLLLMGV